MDINKEIFRIVNNLIVVENYLDYEFKYNYKRLNFLRNKRNSDDNNKFNAQILNALYNLENINDSSFIINNENEDKEFLHKKFNYIYLNKNIQKYNLIYNNKEFFNNEKEIIKNNKHVYMNKYIIKEKNKKKKKKSKYKK